MRRRLLGLVAAWWLVVALAACNGPFGPRATPTPSADDVIRTAEAIAQATRQAATSTPSPAPVTPTNSPVPTTPTVTATPTASGVFAVPNYPVPVRSGPGEQYEQIDLFLQGQRAEVVGRFDDTAIGTWYLLRRIEVGKDGWVWAGAVTYGGDPALIPIVTPSG